METQKSAAALDAIDAMIGAHVKVCPAGNPDECEECDALWTRRSEAHAAPAYRIESREVHVTLYAVYGPNGMLLAAFPTEDQAHDYAMAQACEDEDATR